MTSVAGWASELASGTVAVDILSTLAPNSTYAKLAARGLRVDMSGAGLANLPGWTTTPIGGVFAAEGQPISVRQSNFSKAVMEPHKAALIALFTSEIANRSSTSIESILRAGLETTVWAEVDSVLLGTGAASSAPAGLLNGAIAVTKTTGGGLNALSSDLGALVTAVEASGPVQQPTFIMNSGDAVRALTWAQGLNSDQITVLLSPYMVAKTVAFLDASSFASAAGDDLEVVISKDATLVISAPDPLPMRDAAGVSGAPTTSAFKLMPTPSAY